jgi:peptide/nickel transport system substrate-binding protein
MAVLNTYVGPFHDARARKALALAVDRAAAVRVLGGPAFARPTCQLIPPNVLGFRPYCPSSRNPAAGVWTGADLEAARRLVRRSGTGGAAVTVWTSAEPPLRQLGPILEDALDRLGYRARLRVIRGDRFDYYDAFGPSGTAQIGLFRWGFDFPLPSDVFWILTCDGANGSKFCERGFDRRLVEATELLATDRSRAAERWTALDREVVDRALVVPMVTANAVDVLSGRVGNVRVHPVWGPMYGQMWVR